MSDLTDLQQRFSGPGVDIRPGQNGLPRIEVSTPAAEAHVYLHGAHVTHYQPRGAAPVLFMSKESLFRPDKAIRGGVPLIFPWFGAFAANPKAPQHGFARTAAWDLRDVRRDGDRVSLVLGLQPTEASRAAWPNDFDATCTVTVGPALEMALEVVNKSAAEFSYEEALHTYLAVGDIRRTKLEGLAGRSFIDKVEGFKRKTQPPGPMAIEGETDRVYLGTEDTVTVHDEANGRRIVVSKAGSRATVVWNPWVEKAKAMSDFGDDEWPQMVCVETANAADEAVKLAPGARHVMSATVRVE